MESDVKWRSFESSVLQAGRAMNGNDMADKMTAISRLQSLLEDLQIVLQAEDEDG